MVDNTKNNSLIQTYNNGDFKILLFRDGTKVRISRGENPKPDFPENIDLKLTNRCNLNCSYCSENSTPDGREAKLINEDGLFAYKFLETLPVGVELALGGGALSTIGIPNLSDFLFTLHKKGIIPNITINQFEIPKIERDRNEMDINEPTDIYGGPFPFYLVNGIGVSYRGFKDDKFLKFCDNHPNSVVHVINGVFNEEDYEYLKNRGLKLLILGYKDLRRGHDYKDVSKEIIEENQKWLSENILEIQKHFDVVSFDNLAISQLNMKNKVSEEIWNLNYMGDDGSHTMFIDLPNGEFSVSSTYPKRWKIMDDIRDMFKIVREEIESLG